MLTNNSMRFKLTKYLKQTSWFVKTSNVDKKVVIVLSKQYYKNINISF